MRHCVPSSMPQVLLRLAQNLLPSSGSGDGTTVESLTDYNPYIQQSHQLGGLLPLEGCATSTESYSGVTISALTPAAIQ